eukprot:2106942-Lingulodinium_polyedra.AAC.1
MSPREMPRHAPCRAVPCHATPCHAHCCAAMNAEFEIEGLRGGFPATRPETACHAGRPPER